MAVNEQIGYKDVNPFSQYVIWLKEECAKARWKYNDIGGPTSVSPRTVQMVRLEDWYNSLDELYHAIIGKLEPDEINKVNVITETIDTVSRGDNFSTVNLSDDEIIQIRKQCRELSKTLNLLLWKHRIHVDVKPVKIGGVVW